MFSRFPLFFCIFVVMFLQGIIQFDSLFLVPSATGSARTVIFFHIFVNYFLLFGKHLLEFIDKFFFVHQIVNGVQQILHLQQYFAYIVQTRIERM